MNDPKLLVLIIMCFIFIPLMFISLIMPAMTTCFGAKRLKRLWWLCLIIITMMGVGLCGFIAGLNYPYY
jgi:predicted cobalt transporter CbtA